jgi:hypothetical protein
MVKQAAEGKSAAGKKTGRSTGKQLDRPEATVKPQRASSSRGVRKKPVSLSVPKVAPKRKAGPVQRFGHFLRHLFG